MVKKITVYHKPCLPCVFEDWYLVEGFAAREGAKLRLRRTEYNPVWHRAATTIYGDEMYPPFMEFPNGRLITVEEVINYLKEGKQDDLQRLFRAKNTARKNRKKVSKKKAVEEAEKDPKRSPMD